MDVAQTHFLRREVQARIDDCAGAAAPARHAFAPVGARVADLACAQRSAGMDGADDGRIGGHAPVVSQRNLARAGASLWAHARMFDDGQRHACGAKSHNGRAWRPTEHRHPVPVRLPWVEGQAGWPSEEACDVQLRKRSFMVIILFGVAKELLHAILGRGGTFTSSVLHPAVGFRLYWSVPAGPAV